MKKMRPVQYDDLYKGSVIFSKNGTKRTVKRRDINGRVYFTNGAFYKPFDIIDSVDWSVEHIEDHTDKIDMFIKFLTDFKEHSPMVRSRAIEFLKLIRNGYEMWEIEELRRTGEFRGVDFRGSLSLILHINENGEVDVSNELKAFSKLIDYYEGQQ